MYGKGRRLWKRAAWKSSYDAVIIGGGVHGLAAAYYLVHDHGISDVAVVERRFIGFGGSGRNTAIVRANQRTGESLPLYHESLKLWPVLTRELDFNLMFYDCGNLNLGHSEAEMSALRLQVATAQCHGIDIRLVDNYELKELCPALDLTDRPRFPIFGGMYHPPGGIVRHDALVWGLAKGASAGGVSIHQETEVTGIEVSGGKVRGVHTDRGTLHSPLVLVAAGGYSSRICYEMLGMRLPINVLTIQAMVTQPIKPLLHHVMVSSAYGVYANQTLKGEIATGAHMDPWPNFTTQTTAYYIKHQAEALSHLLPCLRGVKLMRHWAGLADMTTDMAPIMDGNDPVEGLYIDCGWGFFGFKSSAVAGKYMARFIATGRRPELLAPFTVRRFERHELMGETANPSSFGPWN